MGFAPTWLRQVSPLLHKTTLTTEVHSGDHDHLDYCIFELEATNDAQNVRVDTPHGNDHEQQNLSKMVM